MGGRLHRLLATTALLVVAAGFGVFLPGLAYAHGATQNPVSRSYACGAEGGARRTTAACKAAIGVAGELDWDYLRVANVGGRDRTVIPDGKLCSAGIDKYRGLDLARADWPATNLTSGATYAFSYRATVAHQGTFRMYLTKSSYDPTRQLRWSDVDTAPFLTAADPAMQGGAYVMKGRLPTGRTGRHLIYTIWQNTDTPDTYYSCSDVVFPATPTGAAAVAPSANPPTPDRTTPAVAPSSDPVPSVAAVDTSQPTVGGWLAVALAALVVAVAVVGIVAMTRRRRRTSSRDLHAGTG